MPRAEVKFEIDGVEDIITAFETVDKLVREAGRELLKEEGQVTMGESHEEVPTDTGTLQNSSYVEERETVDSVEVELGYGREDASPHPRTGQHPRDYMIYVHENLDAHHVRGKAKFLEDPVRRTGTRLEERLGRGLRRTLRS